MNHNDKVVVITGAANGIGAQLTRKLAAEGARLALADIDELNLKAIADELTSAGNTPLTAVLDVSDGDALEAFAASVYDAYDHVDYCFANAGVISIGSVWGTPKADWEWLWQTNTMGPVNTIRAFIPRMIDQPDESHFVTTASIAGLLTVENSPAYVASKFASLSLTEVLELQLQQQNAKVRAHAICPAIVKSDLLNCARHRRPGTWDPTDPYYRSDDFRMRAAAAAGSMESMGMPTEQAVDCIVKAVDDGVFYILTHPAYNPAILGRVQGVVSGARPTLVQR
jgi:NADP-dependent 3-hydroxy acid dehydrogenase YdfG